MATLTQSIRTYSFIDRVAVDRSSIETSSADAALLAEIDALLSEAGTLFSARNYEDALSTYFACESLIYAHLDPQWIPDLTGKLRLQLPRDASLFTPLLAATSQWLNVLPVSPPVSPVRPPTAVNAQLLDSVANFHGAGLSVVSANPAVAAQALADMQLASIYTAQDNTAASMAITTRAQGLDASIATAFTGTSAVAAAPAAAAQSGAATIATVASRPATMQLATPVRTTIEDFAATRTLPLPIVSLPKLPVTLLAQKQAGLVVGSGSQYAVKTLQWAANASPDVPTIVADIYTPHITATLLPDALMNAGTLWERAVFLPHYYFYTIPLAIAEAYQALGDYANAETYYLEAANYQYINTAIEGPYVWVALATLYRQWGDSVYKQGDRTTAASVYGKVIVPGSTTAPATPLYTIAGLATASKIATSLLPQLATLVKSGVSGVAADDVAIASVLLAIYGKLQQIEASLDFWGNFAEAVPIWTFAYLQQVASSFTQLALQSENEVINYWSQADAARLTKTELTNQVAQANGQINAAQQQLLASQAQANAYQAGLTVAQTRATDAQSNASEYQSTNSQQIIVEATGQQVSGGDDGDYDGVSAMASQYLAGQTISGDSATVAAATDLAANRISQQFQVDSMNRTTTEMQQAATEAQAQLTAANAQVAAAGAAVGVAQLEAQGAQQTLTVFDSDTFTPQVWTAMGNFVEDIYERYMEMALRAALLMQQAYNFENDTTLAYIKSSYQGVIDGLLAADALMADIQAFTEDLVTSTRGKKQYVKQSISLASRYGYLFETQLRKTGTMAFETTLDDFESVYPGTYQGRIQKVSVSVQGIVPPAGISGSLTNDGISFYRLPADVATPTTPSKLRIQNVDTLVISDYDVALDGVIDSTDGNQTGIFEGAGIASSWTLSLPPQINDINYGTLTDVVLTFLYEARYDRQLAPTVLSQLASRPGYYSREWAIPLAWIYPDLFYSFISTGTLTLALGKADFPFNQTAPTIGAVSLLVSTASGTSASGITIALTPPGKAVASGATDATGAISSQTSGSAWAASTGGTALGNWTIGLTAAANPTLAPGGKLNLPAITNLVLVLDYTFAPRA